MYPAQFEYYTPGTVKEALDLLGRHKDDAKLLAGGHSLLPAMKLRLAQPKHLVDLRKISGLSGIKEEGGTLVIGAMTTHYQVESSPVVKSKCPVLAAVAALPTILINQTSANFYFGGTSILIVVGVALDTMKQLEAQLMMRNYEGFLK